MDNDSFFLVQYRNGKAAEIGIQRDLSKVASIKLFGMDMFNTAAECIIDSLMKKDNVICNEKDLQLGTEYFFPEIGVRLWRERAFHPKLLKDPLYMEEMQAVLEDEYQYQYFQIFIIQKFFHRAIQQNTRIVALLTQLDDVRTTRIFTDRRIQATKDFLIFSRLDAVEHAALL